MHVLFFIRKEGNNSSYRSLVGSRVRFSFSYIEVGIGAYLEEKFNVCLRLGLVNDIQLRIALAHRATTVCSWPRVFHCS